MKTRISFVSNSSSSSFVVIGKPVGNLFVDDIELDEHQVYLMRGKFLCDGEDIISLNKNTAKWFKEHHLKDDRDYFSQIDGNVIQVTRSFIDPYGVPMLKVEEGNCIWAFNIDHHSTNSIEDAEYNYPAKRDHDNAVL